MFVKNITGISDFRHCCGRKVFTSSQDMETAVPSAAGHLSPVSFVFK